MKVTTLLVLAAAALTAHAAPPKPAVTWDASPDYSASSRETSCDIDAIVIHTTEGRRRVLPLGDVRGHRVREDGHPPPAGARHRVAEDRDHRHHQLRLARLVPQLRRVLLRQRLRRPRRVPSPAVPRSDRDVAETPGPGLGVVGTSVKPSWAAKAGSTDDQVRLEFSEGGVWKFCYAWSTGGATSKTVWPTMNKIWIRWKVGARTSAGWGPWSDYAEFRFSNPTRS